MIQLTSKQTPMEGRYKTLSAITKPTGKKRLEAGKKGSNVIESATTNRDEKVLEVVFKAALTIALTTTNVVKVDKFLKSKNE